MSTNAITPMLGSVTSSARLNIRRGAPTTTAAIAARVENGTVLAVRGLVQGENVRGNPDWYAGSDDTYFWSGATAGFEVSSTPGSVPVHRRANGTIRPLRAAEIEAVYGKPSYTEAAGGRVVLESTWVTANIVSVPTPIFGGLGVSTVQMHVKARDPFTRTLAAIEEQGLAERILTFGGTFVPRHKGWNPQRSLSAHTWGIAIDLNVQWNGYGVEPAEIGKQGSLRELVRLFEAEGFAWGGYFEPLSVRDGMHFELARFEA